MNCLKQKRVHFVACNFDKNAKITKIISINMNIFLLNFCLVKFIYSPQIWIYFQHLYRFKKRNQQKIPSNKISRHSCVTSQQTKCIVLSSIVKFGITFVVCAFGFLLQQNENVLRFLLKRHERLNYALLFQNIMRGQM